MPGGIINIKLGTPTFSFNIPDDFRFAGEIIPYVLKQLEVSPNDIISRDFQMKVVGGATLDLSKSLNEQGIHLQDPDAGLGDVNAAKEGIFNPNTQLIVTEIELEIFDPNDGAFEPPVQKIELLEFP